MRSVAVQKKRGSRWTGVLLTLAVVGCSVSPPPRPVTGPLSADPSAACLAKLGSGGVVFEPLSDVKGPGYCGVANGVRLAGVVAAYDRPAILTCDMASTLQAFDTGVLQPAAREVFGQEVRTIHHYGAYACRPRRGNAGRASEHAAGRAIDIAAFELRDGTRISVRRDWSDKGARGLFLRLVARRACGVFNLVLSPNYDRAHHDHLHLDIGQWRLCGV